ncbi:hypothetical protein E4T56_gene17332, partial [Termitomyces sp. T112]
MSIPLRPFAVADYIYEIWRDRTAAIEGHRSLLRRFGRSIQCFLQLSKMRIWSVFAGSAKRSYQVELPSSPAVLCLDYKRMMDNDANVERKQ